MRTTQHVYTRRPFHHSYASGVPSSATIRCRNTIEITVVVNEAEADPEADDADGFEFLNNSFSLRCTRMLTNQRRIRKFKPSHLIFHAIEVIYRFLHLYTWCFSLAVMFIDSILRGYWTVYKEVHRSTLIMLLYIKIDFVFNSVRSYRWKQIFLFSRTHWRIYQNYDLIDQLLQRVSEL